MRCKSILTGLLVTVILMMHGCAPVGPDYKRPDTPAPEQWNSELEGGLTAREPNSQTLASWWTVLNDPLLNSILETAAVNNLDLRSAYARLREARARRGIATANLFPTIDFTGRQGWLRRSDENAAGNTTEFYTSTIDAGWELDIFGGIRRSIEAATADLEASGEDLRDVLVILLSETALNYIDVRTFQARLAAINENLQAQEETYQLVQWQAQAGLSDELDVEQARYNLESTRSQIPDLHTGLTEAMNRVAILLGKTPGSVHEELEKVSPIPSLPLEVAVGVPAEALRRRPDVRRAERQLAAQTAFVGVAVSDLYPSFSLTGSIGIESSSFRNLARSYTTYDNWALTGGPQVRWSIFNAGAIRQNIAVQTALQEQALIQYEATVLGALEEVENALVAFVNEQYKNENLRQAADAARNAAIIAQQQYEAGLTDFNNVLDAQRSLLSFENQLAQSNGVVISNLIRLYKSLGGGWTSMANEGTNITPGDNNEK